MFFEQIQERVPIWFAFEVNFFEGGSEDCLIFLFSFGPAGKPISLKGGFLI